MNDRVSDNTSTEACSRGTHGSLRNICTSWRRLASFETRMNDARPLAKVSTLRLKVTPAKTPRLSLAGSIPRNPPATTTAGPSSDTMKSRPRINRDTSSDRKYPTNRDVIETRARSLAREISRPMQQSTRGRPGNWTTPGGKPTKGRLVLSRSVVNIPAAVGKSDHSTERRSTHSRKSSARSRDSSPMPLPPIKKSASLGSSKFSLFTSFDDYPDPPPKDRALNACMEKLFEEYKKVEKRRSLGLPDLDDGGVEKINNNNNIRINRNQQNGTPIVTSNSRTIANRKSVFDKSLSSTDILKNECSPGKPLKEKYALSNSNPDLLQKMDCSFGKVAGDYSLESSESGDLGAVSNRFVPPKPSTKMQSPQRNANGAVVSAQKSRPTNTSGQKGVVSGSRNSANSMNKTTSSGNKPGTLNRTLPIVFARNDSKAKPFVNGAASETPERRSRYDSPRKRDEVQKGRLSNPFTDIVSTKQIVENQTSTQFPRSKSSSGIPCSKPVPAKTNFRQSLTSTIQSDDVFGSSSSPNRSTSNHVEIRPRKDSERGGMRTKIPVAISVRGPGRSASESRKLSDRRLKRSDSGGDLSSISTADNSSPGVDSELLLRQWQTNELHPGAILLGKKALWHMESTEALGQF